MYGEHEQNKIRKRNGKKRQAKEELRNKFKRYIFNQEVNLLGILWLLLEISLRGNVENRSLKILSNTVLYYCVLFVCFFCLNSYCIRYSNYSAKVNEVFQGIIKKISSRRLLFPLFFVVKIYCPFEMKLAWII